MLEGDQNAVERLYASIEQDTRHADATLVRTQTQPDQNFPDWRMGFGALDGGPLEPSCRGIDPGPTETEAFFVHELLDVFDTHA